MGRVPNSVGSFNTWGLLLCLTQPFPHHQDKQWRQCKGQQSGQGTSTFLHALPDATLRVKRSRRTTSNMFSTSNVDSQWGASEGLVWFVGTAPQHGDGGCKLGCGEAGDGRVVGHGFKTRSLPTVSLHPGASYPFCSSQTYAYSHVCVCVRLYLCAHVSMCPCVHGCTHACTYACMRAFMHPWIHRHMCTDVHAHVHADM